MVNQKKKNETERGQSFLNSEPLISADSVYLVTENFTGSERRDRIVLFLFIF